MLEYAARPLGEIAHVRMHRHSSATTRTVACFAHPGKLVFAKLFRRRLLLDRRAHEKCSCLASGPVFAAVVGAPFAPDGIISSAEWGSWLSERHLTRRALERLVKHRRPWWLEAEPGTPQPCDQPKAPSAVSEPSPERRSK